MASEFGRWARIVEELHNGLVALQRGWERSDPMNQPTWINTASRTAIVVSSGDENTGQITFGSPSNRNPKGPSFGALVSANENATLFDAVTATGEMIDVRETWVFLYDSRQGIVYSQLSSPDFDAECTHRRLAGANPVSALRHWGQSVRRSARRRQPRSRFQLHDPTPLTGTFPNGRCVCFAPTNDGPESPWHDRGGAR